MMTVEAESDHVAKLCAMLEGLKRLREEQLPSRLETLEATKIDIPRRS